MFGRRPKILSRAENPQRGYDSFELRLGDEMRGERATLGKSLLDVQRELRIKASYIAAIENTDLDAFDSLSFVAGYVRSYAKYLGMDPEVVFARFCEESGFGGINALKPMESEAARRAMPALHELPSAGMAMAALRPRKPRAQMAVDPVLGASNPFANRATPVFAGFEPGALGSLAVLALLVGGLGYGAWTFVQEIQRVQVAPVEEAPELVAELDPVATTAPSGGESDVSVASAEALTRLYRPQALDAPIMTARDGPIATIAPAGLGALASARPSALPAASAPAAPIDGAGAVSADAVLAALTEAGAQDDAEATDAADPAAPPQVLASAPDAVVLVAVRETWVRVRAATGETLFEQVMQAGDTYEVPAAEAPATLRTGNSGALYMAVAGDTYGPVAPGAQVVSGVALTGEAVRADFAVADLGGDEDLARVVAELSAAPALPGEPPAE
jgi:cytoskeletal protein RodZ